MNSDRDAIRGSDGPDTRAHWRTALTQAPNQAGREIAGELWDGRSGAGTPFGELLPGMDRIPDPPPLDRVGTRSRNRLLGAGFRTWRHLASVTPGQLKSLPNLGRKSFEEIAETLLLAWADLGGEEETAKNVHVDQSPPLVAPLAHLLPDLELLLTSAWADGGARTIGEAWDTGTLTTAAGPLRATVERLRSMSLPALLDLKEPDEDAWRDLLRFDDRSRRVLVGRVFPSKAGMKTLGALGVELGLTRERVRQLQKAVQEQLDGRIASREAAGIRHLAARLSDEVGPVTEPATLTAAARRAVEATTDTRDPEETALRERVLLHLSGPYREVGGLAFSPAGAAALDDTRARVADHPPGSLIPEPLLDGLSHLVGSDERLLERIREDLGVRRSTGALIVWRGSQADKTVAVLTARGEPMAIGDIHEAVGFEVNPRGLAQQIQSDRRLIRRGKEHYGLREWGGEEYSGIAEELEQAIDRSGGAVDLDGVVERFVSEFGVSENSVRSYAAGRRFVRSPEGMLSMRGADDPVNEPRRHPIENARGAFRLEGVWNHRVEVTHDHLRGSGSSLRRPLALAAGLEPELTLGFNFDGTTVTFSWSGNQPWLGSIRGVIASHGCGEGDLLFFPLSGPEPRACRVVRSPERLGEIGVRRLALEIGLAADEVDDDEHPLAVGEALGLPPGADWHDIVDRLGDRGEDDLLHHVPREFL